MKQSITKNAHDRFILTFHRVKDDGTYGDAVQIPLDRKTAQEILMSCLMFLSPSRDELETLYNLASDLNEEGFYADFGSDEDKTAETLTT